MTGDKRENLGSSRLGWRSDVKNDLLKQWFECCSKSHVTMERTGCPSPPLSSQCVSCAGQWSQCSTRLCQLLIWRLDPDLSLHSNWSAMAYWDHTQLVISALILLNCQLQNSNLRFYLGSRKALTSDEWMTMHKLAAIPPLPGLLSSSSSHKNFACHTKQNSLRIFYIQFIICR